MKNASSRVIKFRQRIDNQFHYWGFIDGKFVSPVESSSGENPATSHHDEITGLHDKNVWEKDIIGEPHVGKESEPIGIVEYDHDLAAWVINKFNGGWEYLHKHFDEHKNHKVIGNIYEHPELLKQ